MIPHRYFLFVLLLNVFFIAGGPTVDGQSTSQNAVMLILGSANPKTLHHRVNVAHRLYNSDISFDKIIVSGGCGAHRSSICEASRMDSLLTLKGIPDSIVFKEEKSKSTKQNYCYSKKLSRNGTSIIRKEKPLYVVSDHWHAIPVASCFREAVGVKNVHFNIEGTINPVGPADYTHIFKDCRQHNYCRAIVWALVDAAYFNPLENKIYYFSDTIYYRRTPGKEIDAGFPKQINQYPGWPQSWDEHIDAAYYDPQNQHVFLLRGPQLYRVPSDTTSLHRPQKIADHFQNWPRKWGVGYVDAAYYDEARHKLCLFKDSTYGWYSIDSTLQPADIKSSYAVNWPFQWGSGNVDAAYSGPSNADVWLARGTDYVRYNSSAKSIRDEHPRPIDLPWPEKIWGTRPEIE